MEVVALGQAIMSIRRVPITSLLQAAQKLDPQDLGESMLVDESKHFVDLLAAGQFAA